MKEIQVPVERIVENVITQEVMEVEQRVRANVIESLRKCAHGPWAWPCLFCKELQSSLSRSRVASRLGNAVPECLSVPFVVYKVPVERIVVKEVPVKIERVVVQDVQVSPSLSLCSIALCPIPFVPFKTVPSE